MSPQGAIRKKCLSCCCSQSIEVRLCSIGNCPLFDFRFGRNEGSSTTSLKAIKNHCLDCGEPTTQAVSKCDCKKECVLWPYRLGHNPKRKGLGNKHPYKINSK